MQPLIFDKSSEGLPLTTLQADLSDRMAEISYSHAALWGPLEARLTWGGTLDEAFDAADRWLGCPIEIWSPEGEWLWEGLIWSVSFSAGQRRRTRSREGYYEWVYAFYQERSPTTYATIDGPPQAVHAGEHWGSKTRPGIVLNLGPLLQTSAQSRADLELERRSRLLWLPSGGTLPAEDSAGPVIELECLGWYRTLWYAPEANNTRTFLPISDIIKRIVTQSCPYLSTDHSQMTNASMGGSFDASEFAETPGEIIKRLLGEAAGEVPTSDHTFRLLPGRVPYLQRSKRLSTSIDYVEYADGSIEAAGGGAVPPYLVRPDTILRQADFVPTSSLLATAIDSIESIYLVETSYSSADNSVTYQAAVAGVLGTVASQ